VCEKEGDLGVIMHVTAMCWSIKTG